MGHNIVCDDQREMNASLLLRCCSVVVSLWLPRALERCVVRKSDIQTTEVNLFTKS